MSVDLATIKPGMKIRLKDGAIITVRGSYMSSDGLCFTARSDGTTMIDRNVPAGLIVEVIGATATK